MPYTGRNLNSIMSLSWIQMNLFRYITLIIKQDSQQATSQYKINFFLIRILMTMWRQVSPGSKAFNIL